MCFFLGGGWARYCSENKVWDSVMLFEEAGRAGGLMTNSNKSPDLKLSQTMANSGSLKLEHLYLFCSTAGLRKRACLCECAMQRACVCPVHVLHICRVFSAAAVEAESSAWTK